MLGAIIAILYVPAGMQRLLLVNLTLFQWAGEGEGGGGKVHKIKIYYSLIYISMSLLV